MEQLEGRFLIYDGFQKDAPEIFEKLMRKFNLKIKSLSVYGLILINNRCELELSYETGLQLWLKIPKYNVSEMVAILSIFKGEDIYNRYRKIRMIDDIKDELIELSEFLCEYFGEELKEQ